MKAPNRIELKFRQLKAQKKKAMIVFVTAGDPSLKATEDLVLSLGRSGVDLIELGIPFSDPLADGPTIQASYQRALRRHVNCDDILRLVKRVRSRTQVPVVLMTSYNPVFHYGEELFVKKAKSAGVDGIIVPDLPPEEAQNLIRAGRQNNFATVFLLAPTTSKERMKKIISASRGFVYYVSLTGVTGARKKLPSDLPKSVRLARSLSAKPVCVGFGISSAAQVRAVSRFSDGVIVGSAVVNTIARNAGKKDLVKRVTRFVQSLSKGLSR